MEIIEEMLTLCSRPGATKTALVYRANSNFKRVKEEVEALTLNGLIYKLEEEGREIYHTTAKGNEVLGHLTTAMGAMSAKPRTEQATPRF